MSRSPLCLLLLALAACTAPAPAPHFPGEALRWRSLRWLDENGAVAPGAWQRALDAWRDNVAAAGAVDTGGGVAPAAWTERGPFNVAGRSRTLVIDPRDPNKLWSGGVSGGLWWSGDAGASWNPVDDWWTNLAIGCLAMDPQNPDVMYAGTGEGFYNFHVTRGVNSSFVRGAGIFKTSDGGRTWSQLASTKGWEFVTRVAVSPASSNVVLASTRTGGVWRSTDGGATWANVYAAHASYQVAIDPNDARNAVAHVMDQSLATHWIVYSTDGGQTWQQAQSGLGSQSGYDARMELCYAAGSPGVVYASVGNAGGTIWRSGDGGRNWVQRTTSGSTGATWYFNGFWVDPTNENVMVVAAFHVWRSTDGGRSVQRITDGYIMTVDPHLDVHFVAADPRYDGASNRRVYVTTDGGVHVADDILAAAPRRGWRDLDNGQRSTQFYGAAGHAGAGLIVGGLQDNGTQRLQGSSRTSNMTFGGDGGMCQIDPQNPSYVYGEYVFSQVHRSTNGGASASFAYSGITDASARRGNFVGPLLLDPSAPQRLYAGAASLWRTDNARAPTISWRAVKPSVTTPISAVAVAPGNSDVVWVGHNDGRVFKTTNGTQLAPSWTAVDDNAGANPLPDRYVGRILVDPADENVVWVGLGGFTPDNLWRTADGGRTWQLAAGTAPFALPPAPINGLARHPDDAAVVYAATEVGLWATGDGGAHWSASNDGPANVVVDEVAFVHGSRTLLLATLGRGLWTADVRLPAATPFGAPCAGHATPPVLAADPGSPPRVGGTLVLGAQPVAAGTAHLIIGLSNAVFGGGTLPADLGAVGMTGCKLYVSTEAAASVAAAGGAASWSLPVPADPALLGKSVYAQALTPAPGLNPLGLATTGALELRIGW